jgi:pyruvate,orthophosphate dikinase
LEDKYKPLYFFNDTDEKNKKLFGEKGTRLLEMTKQGSRVPTGFIVTSAMCLLFYDNQEKLLQFLMGEIQAAMRKLEKISGKIFGDSENPLLVSVDSSPPVPIHGIIDNILNLGMNDSTVLGLIKQKYDQHAVLESYLRFVNSFSTIVLGINVDIFKEIKEDQQKIHNKLLNRKQDQYFLLIQKTKSLIKEQYNIDFPNDPYKQLELAISAIFKSWMRNRAVEYRRQYRITKEIADGTAIIVSEMVFDNIVKDN